MTSEASATCLAVSNTYTEADIVKYKSRTIYMFYRNGHLDGGGEALAELGLDVCDGGDQEALPQQVVGHRVPWARWSEGPQRAGASPTWPMPTSPTLVEVEVEQQRRPREEAREAGRSRREVAILRLGKFRRAVVFPELLCVLVGKYCVDWGQYVRCSVYTSSSGMCNHGKA